MVAAQQGQQARPRQQRWRRRRPRTHKGELGTVIPNIPTIAPPDQWDSASPDVLVCACMCMKGTTMELADPSNTRLASFSTVSCRYGHEPGAYDRVDPRTDDPTAQWPAGRKDMPALQSCMRGTGAAGTYSVGPLATAYPATGYSAGYTDVGASVARGDAQFAGQRQAAQDSQTGTSYMASTRPSTARTDDPTAHRPPQTAQAQTAQVQTDRQRTGQAAGRKDMHALQSYMQVTGAAGAYSAGPLATPYPATGYTAGYTGVDASVARGARGDAQFAGERQAAQDSQTRTLYMASTRPSTARTDDLTSHRPPQTAQAQTAQVQTDGQRTGHATKPTTTTVTSVHAMCVPYLLVCLLQHQAELLSPPGQHPPPMGRGLLYDPLSRRTPPNKQRIHPAQTRVVRDHTTDGEIEKNPGPVDAQAKEDDIPPHHREMVTRPASEIETASNPHYHVKLYKYATQVLSEVLKSKRRASTPPPP